MPHRPAFGKWLSSLSRSTAGAEATSRTEATGQPRAAARPAGRNRRRLLIEQLESRLPLAAPTDLAAVAGRVFIDVSGDGYTPGEEVSGATLNLYRDNGDGVWNSASDTLVSTVTSGSDGRYRFGSVTAGNYFVQQPAQTASGKTLQADISPLLALSANDVAGALMQVIDSFNESPQLVFDDTNDGVPVTSSVTGPASAIIGGERDLLVNKTSVNGRVQISVNDPLLPGLLSFDSIQTGQGQRIISWDGVDGDATALNDAGLGNVDMTAAGTATGLRLEVGADSPAGTATIRIYTDDGVAGTASRYSTGVVTIPDTGGVASSLEYLPFTLFTPTSGGGADFSRVGAIELEITGAANVNGSANLVGAIGPTVREADFTNRNTANLSLAMSAVPLALGIGETVTFTLTVNNAGPLDATGIVVRNSLPAGLTYASSAASQGTFDSATGNWTVGGVANGGAATLQLLATVAAAGMLTNVAEIIAADQPDPNSTPGNGVTTEDDFAQIAVTVRSADLSLTKTVNNATPNVGSEVTYTLTVRNAGPNDATGITVREPLRPGLTFVSATSTPAAADGGYNSATGIWTVGAIASGGEAVLRMVVRPTIPGAIVNTAEIMTSDQPDPDSTPGNGVPGEDDQASVTITAQQADLSLTKTVDNPSPNFGETVVYTVTLANSGPSTATNIQVRELLPAGLTLVSSTPSSGTYAPSTGIWTLASLATSTTATLRLVATVNSTVPITNTSEVIAVDQPDPNSTPGNGDPNEDDQASVTITIPSADLSLTNVPDNATPNVGDTVTFAITINNLGPNTATGVTAAAILPAGLTFVSATPSQGAFSPSSGTWTVGSVNSSSTATLSLRARVTTLGTQSVRAEIMTSQQVDPNSTPGNNIESEDDQETVSVSAQSASLALALAVDHSLPLVGQHLTYTFTLTNSGPDTATNIDVRGNLPSGLTYVASNPSVGTYNSATGRWTIPSLAPTATATLNLIASYDAPLEITLTGEVMAVDQFDPNSTPGNGVTSEDDQDSVLVQPATADLSLTQTVDNSEPNLGDSVTFTITVSNAGPHEATGVTVLDLLPPGLAFASATASIGTYSNVTGIWNIGSIPVGASRTLRLVATPTSIGVKQNTAQVQTADQHDPDSTPGNNIESEDDQETRSVSPQLIELSLTKTISNRSPNVGQNVTYELIVRNAGPSTATGVTVLDRLNAGVSYVSSTATNGNYVPGTGIWTLGALAAGTAARLTIIAQVTQVGVFTNVAEIMTADQPDLNSTPGNGDPNEDDYATDTFTTPVADLSILKTVDNPTPKREDILTFTIVVTNSGPDTATNILVTDRIPTDFNFMGSTVTTGTFIATTGLWTIPSLAAGNTATLTIRGRARSIEPFLNTAEITRVDQSDPDSTPGNGVTTEDDFSSVWVTPQVIDLSVTGEIDNLAPVVGDIVELNFTVRNDGPALATGVVLAIDLPPDVLTVLSGTSRGVYDPNIQQWVLGDLARNQTETLTLWLSIEAAGIKQVTFQVDAADQFDIDSIPGNDLLREDDMVSVAINAPRLLTKRLFLVR